MSWSALRRDWVIMARREEIKWFSGRFEADRGVVTGADRGHEWLLPFWFEHYTEVNSYPVCFADFGMSEGALEWCRNRGTVVDLTFRTKRTWFKKPLALLNAPFRDIAWIDADCQVKRNLAPLFDHADGGFATTLDPYRRDMRGASGESIQRPVTSGVIVARNGNELVLKWAAACLSGNAVRGDQEVLNAILSKGEDACGLMPHHFQSLRLDESYAREGIRGDPLIVHWTGRRGKERIRKIMLEKRLFGG